MHGKASHVRDRLPTLECPIDASIDTYLDRHANSDADPANSRLRRQLGEVFDSARTIGGRHEFNDLTVNTVFIIQKAAGSLDSRVYGGGLSYRFTPTIHADAGVW